MNHKIDRQLLALVLTISVLPFVLNLMGFNFASQSIALSSNANSLAEISKDDQFYALTGALHHALLEWSAVTLALIAGLASFVHYYRYKDISVPIIGLALLCAGFTDAFHTLAATRIISANVPNTDFIPFTWAFSRIFNASLMIVGVSLSLWLTRPSLLITEKSTNKANKNISHSTETLISIAILFSSLAIISVILAATSDKLPQTTFANALVTRPYDVLPLALFIFSASLAWVWYQRQATGLKFALLLSIIPEVATQLHMSFGSTALFDNHFNIAHALKIVAYAVLTTGLLISLLQKNIRTASDHLPESLAPDELEKIRFSNTLSKPSKSDLLEVGSAKYPQVFLISSFTFVLAIVITLLVSSIFYVDTAKLAKEQRLNELATHGDFIELLIKNIYLRTEADLTALSNTPPVQGIIRSLKNNDQKNYQLWVDRLNTIFSEILKSDSDYLQIRYIKLSDSNKELVKSYRINQSVFIMPNSRLAIVNDTELLNHTSNRQGQVSFYNSSFSDVEHLDSESALNLVIPIFDHQTGESFGILSIQANFSGFIEKLKLWNLGEKRIYLADTEGKIIYHIDPEQDKTVHLKTERNLQNLFPELTVAINNNLSQIQLGFAKKSNNNNETDRVQGHYRTMYVQTTDARNIVRLFIKMNEKSMQARLAAFRFRSLLLGFGLSIISLALAIFISRKLTTPLQQTTQELVRYGYTGIVGELPINARDETGVLARSFHNMLVSKAANDKELLQQKDAMDEHAIVSITDVKGTISYVNENFITISGYSRKELIGQNHRLINSGYHGLQFFKEMYQTISEGKVWHGEICNKAKAENLYWVKTTIVPFVGKNGKPESYVSIRSDITENKNNVKKLAQARDDLSHKVVKLEEANIELDQFAYVASHDLKSPLNGISQLVTWIEEDCGGILPDDSKEHLSLLKSRSKRMIHLLNDLLEYSRVGRQEHTAETFNLALLVDDIFELQGNRTEFTCGAPDIEVTLQKTPFELVIRNLISNSLKHHDKESGEIKISVNQDNTFYTIRVQDDGPGIPPNLQDKALEMFQTLQSRDKTEGSGMGLALVKKTVEYHGGNLQIDSKGERGTGIIIKWPIAKKTATEEVNDI